MPTVTDLNSVFASIALACDDEIDRRHNHMAIIMIAVAIVLATIGIGVELWMINHMIASFMNGLTNHLMPTQLTSTTTAR